MNTVTNIRTRPFLCNGKMLNDKGFINLALTKITEYEDKTGRAAPINPNFVQWLKDAKTAMDNGVNIVKFKEKTIQKSVPDYSILVNNTIKRNKTLAKQGIFK